MTWIPTFTGRKLDLFHPRPEQIDIRDIAHGLSQISRWTGQTAVPYSVAQHSCLVAGLVPPEFALEGLLHDSQEAYLNDMSVPLKDRLAGYVFVERHMQLEIFRKYGVKQTPRSVAAVTLADMTARATEARDLFDRPPTPELEVSVWNDGDCRAWLAGLPKPLVETVRPWNATKAEGRFLELFLQLTPEDPDRLAAAREMAIELKDDE